MLNRFAALSCLLNLQNTWSKLGGSEAGAFFAAGLGAATLGGTYACKEIISNKF